MFTDSGVGEGHERRTQVIHSALAEIEKGAFKTPKWV